MNILFGESLRRLRRGRGMTQEDLAAQLHVSFQTISKWERDESYPDLTMLPVLARLFGVRTDDLLGINEAENERQVRELMDSFDHGEPGMLERLRAATAEFPLDYRIWVRYLAALLQETRGLEGARAVYPQVREIYENIDTHCTDDSVRMRAKRLFCMFLHSLAQPTEDAPEGEQAYQQEAERMLMEMPELRTCREHIAVMVAPDERRAQRLFSELVWMLFHTAAHMRHYRRFAEDHEKITQEESRELLTAERTMLLAAETLFPDGDYGRNYEQVVYAHGLIGFTHAHLGETEEAYAELLRAAELARAYAALPTVITHTSPLVRGLEYDQTGRRMRDFCGWMRTLFAERYAFSDEFKEDARFQEILNILAA